MNKTLLVTAIWGASVWHGVFAEEQSSRDSGRKLDFQITDHVPDSTVLSKVPYRNRGRWRLREDLDKAIQSREIEYSWFWYVKAVHPQLLQDAKRTEARCVSEVGVCSDDGVFLSWRSNGYELELVDSRLLTLLVQREGLAKFDLIEIFKAVVNSSYHSDKETVQPVVREVQQLDTAESYGRISVNRGRATGWFECPIIWYRVADSVLFVFDKVVCPTPSKIPVNASVIVGGIPTDDVRRFLRFENMNRETLAQEYYEKRANVNTIPHVSTTKGIPLP